MAFGIFEAAITSDYEVGLAKQAASDKMAAAVYDVREKLGGFLFSASSLEEFRDRVAMTKNDQSLYKIIEPHLHPGSGVVRRIAGKNGQLETEFRRRLATPDDGTSPYAGQVGSSDPMGPATTSTPADPEAGVKKNLFGFGNRRRADSGAEDYVNSGMQYSRGQGAPSMPGAGLNSGLAPGASAVDPTGGLLGETALPGMNPRPGTTVGPGGSGSYTSSPPLDPGGPLRAQSNRRRAELESVLDTNSTFEDHQGKELKPSGDFEAWLSGVDQGAKEKVKRNFASREAVAIYSDWCAANNLSPARLSSLDAYATNLPEADYFRLSNTILAWDNEHHPKVPSTELKGKDKVAGRHDNPYQDLDEIHGVGAAAGGTQAVPELYSPRPGESRQLKRTEGPAGPGRHRAVASYTRWCKRNGLKMISASNINHYARGNPQLAYALGMEAKRAIITARHRYADDRDPTQMGHFNTGGDPVIHDMSAAGMAGCSICGGGKSGSRRTAAPDYLQKADDALTQLLNQKAQEFQETIAPLQQALMTVQQAEQLQQQANPLNVLPTPGTVNVMPGQGQTPAQVGMPDPNAPDLSGLAQMLSQPGGGGAAAGLGAPPGGMSDDQGGPPPAAAGGGLPPELDPTAQRAARRRQAGGVGELWDQWTRSRGDLPRGGDVDYEQFKNEKGVGDRALQKLKKRNQNPDWAPVNGQRPTGGGTTVGRRKRAYGNENGTSDDFHSPHPHSPQAEYKHPGEAHGWKGQFDEDQYAPYTGERYTKGQAKVHGGPGPDGSQYFLHTPHGRSGPHPTPEHAFKAAEPFLGQQGEIDRGQGVMPDFPKGRVTGQRKQAWSGWGPAVHPKVREVTGWKWDNHLNGYLADRPERFACNCGSSFNTPTGFQRCACGKQWNSYVIGTGGNRHEAAAEKFLVREIPTREGVIVANRRRANYEDMPDEGPQPIVGKPADADYHLDRGNTSAAWALHKEKQHGKPLSQFTDDDWAIAGEPPRRRAVRKGAPFAGYDDFDDCTSKNSDKGDSDAYCGEIKHRTEDKKSHRLVDPRTGKIHNLVDPGELGDGEDDGLPSMKYPPKDWARRGDGAKWQKSPIGR